MPPNSVEQIAAILGLPTATVALALANSAKIPKPLRLRVLQEAKRLGYTGSLVPLRQNASRAAGFVGIVLSEQGYGREDSYLSEFITGLGKGMSDYDADLFISVVPEGASEIAVIENIVRSRRADGIVIARTYEADPRVDLLLRENFPFVTHGRVMGEDLPFPWIDTDGVSAFRRAFELLYGLGHRRFGLLTIEEAMMFRHYRTEGLRAAIEDKGDPSVSLKIATAPRFASERRRQVIANLLSETDRPTAVMCLFDGLALSLMSEASAMGLGIPNDLSVIGFDNTASAAHVSPGLTTFDNCTVEGGRMAAAMLMERIASGSNYLPRHMLIHPELILRGSHGPAKVGPANQML